MDVTRREITMIAGAASMAAALPGRSMAAEPARLPWYRTIKRAGQTNFNERDPEFGDVEAWADYWASAKVQAVILSVSGPVAFYPPEAVYQRDVPSNRPSVVTREVGGTRLAYLAGDMDASYWRFDNADLGQLIVNVTRWLLNGRMPLTVTGDGLMEVIGWQTRPGYAVHLLNYNGPNAFRGHMRKPLPLGQQQIRLTLADDRPVRSARLLKAGGSVAFQQKGRMVELTVPGIGMYEVVALEM